MGERKETEIGQIPIGWDVGEFNSICELLTDGSHYSPKLEQSSYYMASVKDMRYNYFDFSDCKTISKADFDLLVNNNCSPQIGDVIISKDGANCLDLIFVYKQSDSIVVLSSIAIARLKKEYDPDFYRYYLLSPDAQYLMRNQFVSGSAIPRVILKDFKKIKIPLFDNNEQRAIASILNSLDNKIDFLHRQNKTLEQLAETLFRQWFVEEADESWELSKLSEIANVQNGYAFRSSEYESFQEGHLEVLKMGHIERGGGLRSNPKRDYVPRNEKLKKWILNKNDIVMAMTDMKDNVVILGVPAMIDKDDNYVLNQRVARISLKQDGKLRNNYLLYVQLKDSEFIAILQSKSNSGVQVNLSTETIKDCDIIVPPLEIQNNKGMSITNLYLKKEQNSNQIRTLTQLRDTLLPKLMSGEVRVKY